MDGAELGPNEAKRKQERLCDPEIQQNGSRYYLSHICCRLTGRAQSLLASGLSIKAVLSTDWFIGHLKVPPPDLVHVQMALSCVKRALIVQHKTVLVKIPPRDAMLYLLPIWVRR